MHAVSARHNHVMVQRARRRRGTLPAGLAHDCRVRTAQLPSGRLDSFQEGANLWVRLLFVHHAGK